MKQKKLDCGRALSHWPATKHTLLAILVIGGAVSASAGMRDIFKQDDGPRSPRAVRANGSTALGGHIPLYFAGANQGSYPVVTSAVPEAGNPAGLDQIRAFPNPFTVSTTIRLALSRAGTAKVEIYDPRGARVRTLEASARSAGPLTLTWDGCGENGEALPSGVYLYRVDAGTQSVPRRLLLIR